MCTTTHLTGDSFKEGIYSMLVYIRNGFLLLVAVQEDGLPFDGALKEMLYSSGAL